MHASAHLGGRCAAHAARIRRCTLALDARRWGAHTTALDALWAGVGTLSVLHETHACLAGGALACKCSSRRLRFSPQVPGETLASRAAHSIHSAIGAVQLSAASLRASSDLATALALDTALGWDGPLGRSPTTAPPWMAPRRPPRRPVSIESVLQGSAVVGACE